MNKNKYPLHGGAYSGLFENAKQLRAEATEAEEILWEHLRSRSLLNLKFRRQHPLRSFVVDFYCHKLKLIIEADGGYHNSKEQKHYDTARTNELENLGFTVVRFTNKEIIQDTEKVLQKLADVVRGLLSNYRSGA